MLLLLNQIHFPVIFFIILFITFRVRASLHFSHSFYLLWECGEACFYVPNENNIWSGLNGGKSRSLNDANDTGALLDHNASTSLTQQQRLCRAALERASEVEKLFRACTRKTHKKYSDFNSIKHVRLLPHKSCYTCSSHYAAVGVHLLGMAKK